MKMKVAYLGLCLLASVNAAQFTQSFLEYSASEVQQENAFDDWKETVTAPYRARHLSHTLPAFIVPRECNYSAINHTPTSTNPIDQMICPDRCGSGRDFTLRIETQCDRQYQQQGRTCSSVITCAVTGCTNGAITCPPVELLDLNTALDEACAELCGAPVAPPVTAPISVPVAVPVPQPVPQPVVAPIAVPQPVPGPVALPTPVSLPTPLASPVITPTVPTVITPTVPTVPTPTAPVFQPVMGPVSGKRTGVLAPVPTEVAFMPTPDTLPVTTSNMAPVTGEQPSVQSVPSPQPVLVTSESESVEGLVGESTPKQSTKQPNKSKKSKSSSYCDDGSGKNAKRCLKRKST